MLTSDKCSVGKKKSLSVDCIHHPKIWVFGKMKGLDHTVIYCYQTERELIELSVSLSLVTKHRLLCKYTVYSLWWQTHMLLLLSYGHCVLHSLYRTSSDRETLLAISEVTTRGRYVPTMPANSAGGANTHGINTENPSSHFTTCSWFFRWNLWLTWPDCAVACKMERSCIDL